MLDSVANFIKLFVSTGYDQNATSIVLRSGGSNLPAAPFNLTWWNVTDFPDPANDPKVEIVRVTAVSGNTLTIQRAQEGTTATIKNLSGKTYQVALGITAKMITDIGAGLVPTAGQYKVYYTVGSSNADYITDGVADNVQIQQALNDAATAGGGTVFLKSGTYNISSTINLPVTVDNVRLTGAGRSSIVRASNSLNSDMFLLDVDTLGDSHHFEMDSVQLDGNSSNQTSGSGIHIKNPNGTHLVWKSSWHDLYIYNVKENGFYFDTSNTPEACYMHVLDRIFMDNCGVGLFLNETIWTEVSNIEIYNPISYGIRMIGIVSQMQFVDIRIECRSGKTADGLSGSISNSSFTNVQISYAQKAYDITTIEPIGVVFVNCLSWGAAHWGFRISNQSYTNHQTVLIGCSSQHDGENTSFASNERVGFWLDGGGNFIMMGCIVDGQTPDSNATQYALRHSPTDTSMTVMTSGCLFRDCAVGDFYNNSGTAYSAQWSQNTSVNNVSYSIPANISATVPSGNNQKVLVLNQNDTTNNPTALEINNSGTGASIYVTPTGNTPTNVGIGAAIYLKNNSNTGIGLGVDTNISSAAAHLVFFRSLNDAFNQNLLEMVYHGTQNALYIEQDTTTNPSAVIYLTDASTNSNYATLYATSARSGQTFELHNSSSGKVISVNADGTGKGIIINMAAANTARALEVSQPGNSSSAVTGAYFNTTNAGTGAAYALIVHAGRVGIGVDTPSHAVQITNSTATKGLQINQSGNENSIEVNHTATSTQPAVSISDSNGGGNFAALYLTSNRSSQSLELHNSSSGKVITANADGTGKGILVNMAASNSSNAIEISQPANSSSAVTGLYINTTNAGTGAAYGLIVNAGKVGFGTATPASSAAVEIASTTGAFLIPRMTTTQKNALTAVNGMIVYDSTLNKFQGFEGGAWTNLI